ncbi:MAG: transcriptional regulator [Spirochaetes bacterium]|nr:transcriptional regulator [Spirochaetota bacterium]MBN2769374.1 transcriptional regulator [Spirochaetota bacterium]
MIDNDTIHSRPRFLILVILSSVDECNFKFLKEKLEFTDGVLSVHLTKLEEAGYVKAVKSYLNKRPNSVYSLTQKGQKALLEYVEEMESLFEIIKESL